MTEMAPKNMELNAKLQQKKNALRKELAEIGTVAKEGVNQYDKYKYMSEAQYKKLFTGLFSKHSLELKFTELEYGSYTADGKQPNGRLPKIQFTLFDIETGFGEDTVITGEGLDKGDKAGYKAYTGALKYFLADTFMVATGDDPETESPEGKRQQKAEQQKVDELATADMVSRLRNLCDNLNVNFSALLAQYKVETPEMLTRDQYVAIARRLSEVKK